MTHIGHTYICVADSFPYVRVGHTSGNIQPIWTRFAAVWGNGTRIFVFSSDRYREIDKSFYQHFKHTRDSCKLYHKEHLDEYIAFIRGEPSELTDFFIYQGPSTLT